MVAARRLYLYAPPVVPIWRRSRSGAWIETAPPLDTRPDSGM